MSEHWAETSQQLDAQSRSSISPDEVGERLYASARQPLPEKPLKEADEPATSDNGTLNLAETVQSLKETAQRLHDTKVAEFKSDKNLQRFNENMDLLQARAKTGGVPESEVKDTLHQVLRLMMAPKQESSTVGDKERMMLAQQVLQLAAKPSEIVGLGKHFTCSAQAVEERIYINLPSKAAKLVADIALNNQFVTSDGTKVSVDADSLKPDDESKNNPALSGERNYASHIFAITALNVHYARLEVDPTGKPAEKGAFRFAQMPKYRGNKYKEGEPFFDRGERLLDMRTTPPSIIYDAPLIDISHLAEMYQQITGTNDNNFVVENKAHCTAPSICVDSTQSLQDLLTRTKENREFPLLLRVHTGNDDFIDADKTGIWHVVNILDFNPQKKEAFVSDQAGKSWDKFIKIDKLYRATLDPPVRFRPNLPPFQNPNLKQQQQRQEP